MQTIQLRQFGIVLVSRPAGLEAFNAIQPTLDPNKTVNVNFDEILTVTPSWFDEFITHLADFMQGNVVLLPTDNASVNALLSVLIDAHKGDEVAKILKAEKALNKAKG